MPKPTKKSRRPLTDILLAAGREQVFDNLGNPVSRAELLSRMLWEYTTEGSVKLLNGRILEPNAREWKDAAQWIYGHADGPARSDVSLELSTTSEIEQSSVEELEELVRDALDPVVLAALLGTDPAHATAVPTPAGSNLDQADDDAAGE